MTLRTKIGLIIGVTLLALILVIYESAHAILLSGFVESETQSAQRDIARGADALSDQLAALDLITGDYADWDDTYTFIIDHNRSYIDANMIDAMFSQQRLNLVILVNLSGEVVYSKSFDLQTDTAVPVPPSLSAQLLPNSVLLQHAAITSSVTGIVVLPEGPLLVASRPILTSHFEGPARGTLIMGRYLDGQAVSQLGRTTHLALTLHPIDDPLLPADARAALLNSSLDSPTVTRPTDDQTIAGYAVLKDVYGRPVLVLQADIARDIYQRGRTAIDYFMLWLIGILVVAGVIGQMLVSGLIRSRQMRERAETEIRTLTDRITAETALHDSEERFRQLAENIHEVFWMTAPDRQRVLYISPGYEEIWGRTCESVYANPDSLIEAVHPDDRGRVRGYFDRQRRGESAFAEYRIIRPDNTIGWIWDRAFPIRNQRGEVYRMAGIAEDVTDRKQTEEGLQRALAKEKELGELKSRFISMTSHEFRTPLTAILSSAEMLDRYGQKLTDERKRHHLLQIQASVKNMTRLLEDVLVIGKAEAQKLEFNPGPLDLEQFCRSLVDELQLSAGTRHQIRLTHQGPCSAVTMDAKLLRQILTNLLSNAIKYSPAGGLIELEVSCQGHEAVLCVADHGIGIPPAAYTHLFETFHRADNVGNIPGTGLGLAIVKKSVDLHRGTIVFSSAVGAGTEFIVRLPTQFDAPLPEANGS